MAIIKCKNCGNEISSFCGSCPFCGRKLDYNERDIPVRNTIGYKHQNYYSPYGNTYVDTGSYGAGWALGFLLGVTGLIIASCIDKEDTKNQKEIPQEILDLVEQRKIARQNKDWAKSDELRDLINQKGYDIKDTANGTELKQR